MNKISKDSCKESVYCAQVITPLPRALFLADYLLNETSIKALNSTITESVKDYYQHFEIEKFEDFSYEDIAPITEFICKCTKNIYDCKLFETIHERNLVENEILKNTYLALYIIIMLAALIVNIVFFVLISSNMQHRSYCLNFFRKFTHQQGSTMGNTKLNGSAVNSMDNNLLLISLLISYTLTIAYVLPRQLYLFYTGLSTHGHDCKFTEFTKAFTVSLTIYSLVAISLHQLFTLKFATSISKNSRKNQESLFGSLKEFLKRKIFLSWSLFLTAWFLAFSIGYFSMQRYSDKAVIMEFFETFSLICEFPSYLKPKYDYCTINSDSSSHTSISIGFFILLLVVPNLIIFISYGYICYHIWSTSRQFISNERYSHFSTQQSHTQLEQPTMHVSILKSDYLHFGMANACEMNKAIASATFGRLNEAQIMEITKVIKSNAHLKPVWIDINYKARYNAFEVETVIKHDPFNQDTKNSIKNAPLQKNYRNTGNITRKRNKTVTLTVCLMAICFTLCWVPFFSFPLFYYKIVDNYLYINLKVAIHLIGYSSSIWSPLIYILRCERFKNSAKPLKDSLKSSIKDLFNKFKQALKCKCLYRLQKAKKSKLPTRVIKNAKVRPMKF